MRISSPYPPSTPSDSGAVLVIFALVVVLLFMVLALALDTSLFSAARSQHRYTAEVSLLAGVEAYGEEYSASGDRALAFASALAKVKQVINANIASNVGRMFFEQTLSDLPQDDIGEVADGALNGYLIPVRWYFPSDTAGGCTRDSSCDPDCRKPCAVEDPDTSAEVNALRLVYRTNDDSLLRPFIGRIFDESMRLKFEEVVTGTLVARNAVFLLDLSTSMTGDSHDQKVDYDPVTDVYSCLAPFTGFFAYQYDLGYAGACAAPAATNMGYYEEWDACPVDHGFADEYTCFSTVPFSTFTYDVELANPLIVASASGNGVFLVQTNPDATESRGRPEPLSSALDGIHEALTFFATRRVPGDGVGIVGFDSELVKERILSDIDARDNDQKLHTANVGSSEFLDFVAATDTSTVSNFVSLKPLFPRDRDLSGGAPGSEIYGALKLGRKIILDTPDSSGAQNFVVAFTDGLGNCNDTGCEGSPGSGASVLDWSYYNQARTKIDAELAEYKNSRIAFHLFLLGSNTVRPHELAWRDPATGNCLNQDGIKSLGLGVVNSGANTAAAYQSLPFTDPNRLFASTKATGGLFHPVRPCYKESGSCVPLTTNTAFANDCNLINNNTATRPVSAFWDSSGRIKYDLYGETTQEQILTGMRRILSKSPFMLVKEY